MSTKHHASRAVADAEREAAAEARRRAVAIVELCAKYNAGSEATRLILSSLSAEEVEAIFRQRAATASWDKAVTAAISNNGLPN